MKVAVVGGSFNPPHQGHVALVQLLLHSKSFDEVWMIPCLAHAFGKKMAPFEDRLRMCELAFSELSPQVKILKTDFEIQNTKGYSVLTLQHLCQKNPQVQFFWVMGTDLMQQKKQWKNFDEIEKMASLYPIARAGYEASLLPEISSSEIREKISRQEAIASLIPKNVEDYLKTKGLYR